jgi:hypothetical protein
VKTVLEWQEQRRMPMKLHEAVMGDAPYYRYVNRQKQGAFLPRNFSPPNSWVRLALPRETILTSGAGAVAEVAAFETAANS